MSSIWLDGRFNKALVLSMAEYARIGNEKQKTQIFYDGK
jgi:hypothetical protein